MFEHTTSAHDDDLNSVDTEELIRSSVSIEELHVLNELNNKIRDNSLEKYFGTDPNFINEYITQGLSQARRDLIDLSNYTTKLLGRKAIYYQENKTHTLADNDEDIPEATKLTDSFDEAHPAMRLKTQQLIAQQSKLMKKKQEQQQQQETKHKDKGHSKEQQILNQFIQSLQQREQAKKKSVTQQQLKEIYARVRNLIESLWEEMHIKHKDRDKFMKQYFYPETLMNYLSVYHEIDRLCKMRSVQHRVIKLIEQREVYTKRLKDIARLISISAGAQLNSTESNMTLMLRSEVPALVQSIRQVTVQLVEAIVHWRKVVPDKSEFFWDGTNYMITMQNDLDFLRLTELAQMFDYSMEANPMLLPPHLRSNKSSDAVPQNKDLKEQVLVHKKSFQKLTSQSNANIFKISTVIPAEQLEKLQAAEKLIFQEHMYIEYLQQQKKKRDSMVTIQCTIRRLFARRQVYAMIMEKKHSLAQKQKELNMKTDIASQKKGITPIVSVNTSTAIASVASLVAAQLQQGEITKTMAPEEIAKTMQTLTTSFLGADIKLNGHYKKKLQTT